MVPQVRQVRIQFDPIQNITSNTKRTGAYCSNRITTAKYGYSSFFPKFFYEQFRRYSNIFFTFIALFQQIPDVSPTGRYTTLVPLLCIFGVSAIKELFEDMKRHKADRKVNESEIRVLNKTTLKWDLIRWQDVRVGDIVKCLNENFFPSDIFLLSSSELSGMCYIETANLDGETNLKIRQSLACTSVCITEEQIQSVLSSATIECDPPNPKLYEFEGRLLLPNGVDTYPLGPDNILLRGAKLRNTSWVCGIVLYTGHESKLMINSLAKTPIKQSRLEKTTNHQILWLVFILLTTGLLSAFFSELWTRGHMDFMRGYVLGEYVPPLGFGMTYLTFVILYNNLVPISLQVSLEVVRTFQAHFINSDLEMYDEASDTFAMARTSNLNEELGQVRYILSDKTGTLTKNVMTFKKCSVNGQIYDETSFDLLAESAQNEIPTDYSSIAGGESLPKPSGSSFRQETYMIREFLTLLAVCHTVVPEKSNRSDNQSAKPELKEEGIHTPKRYKKKYGILKKHIKSLASLGDELEISAIDSTDDIDLNERGNEMMISGSSDTSKVSNTSILYHAASPDEGALVRGVQKIGYEFTNRTPKFVYVSKFGHEEAYEVLNVFEFDSFRKRMSVILRCPDQQIRLYTKGADSVIFERLKNNQLVEETSQHLQRFAHDGFRTLCCAYSIIDQQKYDIWCKKYQESNLKYGSEKAELIEGCHSELERDLTLLGATAIEDELQDDVPDTIDTLLKAGINFWLLTGDKQETAINIGFSCKLLSRLLPLIIINEESYDATREQILRTVSTSRSTLVIDGKSLYFALKPELRRDFMRIALKCKSVICCRVSPFQKAEMVKLVKELTGDVTLAIGDGANDVAMIRTANIGIGISGTEGLQAAHAADYTISQFRFLSRLLLVHGSWSMSRLKKMILYSFYKNIALYVVEFWFAIVSAWSGQTIFDRWTIGLYNVIFTAAPPIAIGVFDRRCSADLMVKYPQLYRTQVDNQSNTIRNFWIWIATAFWHSLLLFWFTYLIISHDALWSNGKSDGGYLVFGNMLYTYVVVTVCLKAGLEMDSWTILTHLAIWGSILSWFIFLIIYSRLWPTFPIAPDMVAIDELIFGTWLFWLGLALIPFSALLTDLVYKVIKKTCFKKRSIMLEEGYFNGQDDESSTTK